MTGATLATAQGFLKKDYKSPKDLHMRIAKARMKRRRRR